MQGPRQKGANVPYHVWRTLMLALPMVLSRLGIVAMSTVDVLVLGKAGTDALADYVLGQAIQDSLVCMTVGLMLGVPVLVAREAGAGNKSAAGRVWRRGLSLGTAFGLFLSILLQFSEPVYLATGQDPDLARRAASVTGILAIGLPFLAVFVACTSFLEAIERPAFGVVVMLIGTLINLGLSVVFVFGAGPLPPMGASGSALATTLTMAILATGSVWYVRYHFAERKLFGIVDEPVHTPSAPQMKEQLGIGSASGGAFLFEASAQAVLTGLVGWLGVVSLAAHGVLFQFLAIPFMVAYGIAGATQVRVSNAWGRGDGPGAMLAGWSGLGVAFVLTGSLTILIAAVPEWAFSLFTCDPEVIAVASPVLMWVLLATMFDGGQVVLSNACRGRGDAWAPTAINFASYWLIMVPLAWFLTTLDGRGLSGIYQAILIASIASTTALCIRFQTRARTSPRHPMAAAA